MPLRDNDLTSKAIKLCPHRMKQALSSISKQNLEQQGKLEAVVQYQRSKGKNLQKSLLYYPGLRIMFIVQNLKHQNWICEYVCGEGHILRLSHVLRRVYIE